MNYYSASIFFRSEHVPPLKEGGALWEERVYLIKANTENDARLLAEALGRNGEHEYTTEAHGLLKWKYVRTERVAPIEGDVTSGACEVFSRFLRDAEAASILEPIEE